MKSRFTDIIIAGVERPQCVVCLEVLAHESLKPAKFQRHLQTKHPHLKDKSIDFLKAKVVGVEAAGMISVDYFKTKIEPVSSEVEMNRTWTDNINLFQSLHLYIRLDIKHQIRFTKLD